MIDSKRFNLTLKEMIALLDFAKEEAKVEFTKPRGTDVFILSGSFQQIEKSRNLLQTLLSKTMVCNENDKIKSGKTSPLENKSKVRQDGNEGHLNVASKLSELKNEGGDARRKFLDKGKKGSSSQSQESCKEIKFDQELLEENRTLIKTRGFSQNSSRNGTVKKDAEPLSIKDSRRCSQDKRGKPDNAPKSKEKHDGSIPVEKTSGCTNKIEISSKVWYVFVKIYEKELQGVMKKFSVTIEPEDNNSTALIKPLKECNEEKLKMAVKKLTGMYEEANSKMNCVWFALADPDNQEDNQKLRQTVIEVKKILPVVLERAADRQSWEIFGESDTVEKGMKLLEKNVKLQRKELNADDETEADSGDENGDKDKESSESPCDDDDDDDDDDVNDGSDDDLNGKLEHSLGRVKLSVYRGDITDEDSDAIVNAANEGLDHGAGVAKTIVSKGGTSIQDECTRIVNTKGKLKIGEAKVSHSGDLKCKMIIHAVGPNWKDDNGENGKALLKKACQESLHQAQKYSFKSIAFPAISSGIYGMPKKICAQVMFDVAEEYSKNYTSQSGFGLVADIRFVNNDVKTVNIFKREFKARYSHGKQMEEHTQYVVTPADPSVRRFGDDLKRTSNDLPRISRTWRVENSNTVKTKEIKSESTGRSERPSTDKQPSTSDSQANSRNQGNWESYSYGDERPKHRSIHSSPDKQESMYQSQTRSYKVSHILPDKQESTSQTHPRNQRIVKSYSFSGARPKQRSVYEEMIQAEHQPLSSSNKSLKDGQPECGICRQPIHQPKTLPKCKHTFCKGCLETALRHSAVCPYCREPQPSHAGRQSHDDGTMDYRHDQFTRARNQFDQQFSQPHGLHMRTMDYQQEQFSFPGHRRETRQIQRGSQPIGSMVHRQEQFTLPGYEEHGTILIQYTFSGGLQGPEHPNPGQRYDGTSRSAYLPDNPEGRQVLKLLIKAFDAGLVFKIGRSMTSRMDNQIIWADIPHKTCRTGGPSNYGYPDPMYLSDVKQQLQAVLKTIV